MLLTYYVDYDNWQDGRNLKLPEFINKDYKDLTADDKKNILQQCAQDFYDEDPERMDGFTLYIHVYSPENDEDPLFCGFVETETIVRYTVSITNEE